MKEVIFHIGLPKTGTSALQVFFAKNAKALQRQSVDYLDISDIGLARAGNISSGNGAHLARSLYPPNHPFHVAEPNMHISTFFGALSESKAERIIISSELFADAERGRLGSLLNRLREQNYITSAVFYIRSQVQHLSSSYMQQVKRHGCTVQPDEYIRDSFRKIGHLKYFTFFTEMQKFFGNDRVYCRSYDEVIATNRGIAVDFLATFGIDSSDLNLEVRDVNTSLSPKELAIMLLINRFAPRMQFSDLVVENAARFGSAASGGIHSVITSELRSEIEEFFREENRLLATSYFKRDDLFSNIPIRPQERISVDELSNEDLVAFFGGLLVRYDGRLEHQAGRLAELENRIQRLSEEIEKSKKKPNSTGPLDWLRS